MFIHGAFQIFTSGTMLLHYIALLLLDNNDLTIKHWKTTAKNVMNTVQVKLKL